MAENTNTNTNTNNEEQSLLIIGAGNNAATTILSQSVVTDPLPKPVAGIHRVRIDGINGKGEEGKVNPLTVDTEFSKRASNMGEAILATYTVRDAERFEFPSPTEENTIYRVIYDVNRRKSAPIGFFKISYRKNEEDGKWEAETTELTAPVELVPSNTLTEDNISAMATILSTTLPKLENRSSIVDKLKEIGLRNLKKESDCYAMLEIVLEKGSQADITLLEGEFFKERIPFDMKNGGLEMINPISANGGISIGGSYKETADIYATIVSEEKDSDSYLQKAVRKWGRKAYGENLPEKLVESEMLVGVDEHENIVVIDDSNVPYKGGGQIHAVSLEGFSGELKTLQEKVNIAVSAKLHKIDPENFNKVEEYSPLTDIEMAKLEEKIGSIAAKACASLGEKEEENFLKWKAAQVTPSMVISQDGVDAQKLLKAKSALDDMKSIALNAYTKAGIEKGTIKITDEYIKDGRQKGVAYSVPKKPMGYDFKNGEKMIVLTESLPTLVKTKELDVLNYKEFKTPRAKIVLDKNGDVKDIAFVNGQGLWRDKMLPIRVLASLNSLDEKNSNIAFNLASMLNNGYEDSKGEYNGYGIQAVIKKLKNTKSMMDIPEVKEFFQSISGVQGEGKAYDEQMLKEVKEKIAALKDADSPNLRAIASALQSVEKKNNEYDNVYNSTVAKAIRAEPRPWMSDEEKEKVTSARKEAKEMLISALNGNIPEKIKTGVAYSAARTATIIKEKMSGVVNNVLDKNTPAKEVALKLGQKFKGAKEFKLFYEYQGNITYANRVYSPKVFQFKENERNIETFLDRTAQYANKLPVGVAIEDALSKIKENYSENRVVANNSTLYTEDKTIDIDLDLGDLLGEEDADMAQSYKEYERKISEKSEKKEEQAKETPLEKAAQEEAAKELDSENRTIPQDAVTEEKEGDMFSNITDASEVSYDEEEEEEREQTKKEEMAINKASSIDLF